MAYLCKEPQEHEECNRIRIQGRMERCEDREECTGHEDSEPESEKNLIANSGANISLSRKSAV